MYTQSAKQNPLGNTKSHVMCLLTRDHFTFPSKLDALTVISCLIVMATTPNTMFIKSDKTGHFWLIPYPRGKTQLLTIKCYVSCGVFIDVLYQVEKVPFYS